MLCYVQFHAAVLLMMPRYDAIGVYVHNMTYMYALYIGAPIGVILILLTCNLTRVYWTPSGRSIIDLFLLIWQHHLLLNKVYDG